MSGTSPGRRAARASRRRRAARAAPRGAPRPGGAAPWQACTWTLAVVGGEHGRGRVDGRVPRDVGLEPDSSDSGSGPSRRLDRRAGWSVGRCTGSVRCSSRTSRPSEVSSGWRAAGAGRRRGAGRAPDRPDTPARVRRRDAAARRGRRGARPRAARSSTSVTAIRVWPNSDSRAGRRRPPGRRASSARGRRRDGGRGRARERRPSARQARAARPGRVESGAGASLSTPAYQSASSRGRCAAYDANRPGQPPGDRVRRPRRSSPLLPVSPVAEMGAERGTPGLARAPSTTPAAARPARRGPRVLVTVSVTSAATTGASGTTRAHPVVGVARGRGGGRRWLSQRSMPRAGTAPAPARTGRAAARRADPPGPRRAGPRAGPGGRRVRQPRACHRPIRLPSTSLKSAAQPHAADVLRPSTVVPASSSIRASARSMSST